MLSSMPCFYRADTQTLLSCRGSAATHDREVCAGLLRDLTPLCESYAASTSVGAIGRPERPGATRFDATAGNRPGRHGLWQRLAPTAYRALCARVFVCAPCREDYGQAQLEALASKLLEPRAVGIVTLIRS